MNDNESWADRHSFILDIILVGVVMDLFGLRFPKLTTKGSLALASIIPLMLTGCYFLHDGGRTPASESSWWWYGEYHQTRASWPFFIAMIIAFFVFLFDNSTFAQAWRNVKAREAEEAALAAQMAADAAWLAQEPRTLVPATVTPSNAVVATHRRTAPVSDTPAPAPTSTSKLWLPSSTERRVRRGGTTLSGTPIKDRRSVNPETLFDDY